MCRLGPVTDNPPSCPKGLRNGAIASVQIDRRHQTEQGVYVSHASLSLTVFSSQQRWGFTGYVAHCAAQQVTKDWFTSDATPRRSCSLASQRFCGWTPARVFDKYQACAPLGTDAVNLIYAGNSMYLYWFFAG